MKGIKFDGNHSYDVYQLFLNSYSIGEAEPNTNLVEIPGVDGAVDFTEYFGGVTYKSRTLKMQFTFTADRFGLNAAYAKLQNALNGKRVKIVLDDDKDYFYTGRVSVGELSPDGQIGKVTLTATCDPYKYKNKARTVTCSGHTVGKGVGTAGGTAATLIRRLRHKRRRRSCCADVQRRQGFLCHSNGAAHRRQQRHVPERIRIAAKRERYGDQRR